jgi:hypothetical protein
LLEKTAFLYGDLDNPVYMKVPQGLEYFKGGLDPQEHCLLLNKVWTIASSKAVVAKIYLHIGR